MSEHRYTQSALRGDYARAAIGLAICAGVVLGLGVGGFVMYLFGALAALFGYFAWRTWVRHVTVVRLDNDGIATSGVGDTRLSWDDLRALKLNFYAKRRNHTDGWMQLTAKGAKARVDIDSHIENFAAIAARAHQAATANGLTLPAATVANFAALGIGGAAKTRWGNLRDSLSESVGGDDAAVASARRQP